ncbi:hypothetical protein [uncultured Brevundimonas sp.]|uniref:hypothetical protein n=1 Tax=uncultured Brevundimonas sp. TaxID=213418 RepID=UPI0025FCF662|nr:hypothetical protein [uncultured Brevundimonas sp.]
MDRTFRLETSQALAAIAGSMLEDAAGMAILEGQAGEATMHRRLLATVTQARTLIAAAVVLSGDDLDGSL